MRGSIKTTAIAQNFQAINFTIIDYNSSINTKWFFCIIMGLLSSEFPPACATEFAVS